MTWPCRDAVLRSDFQRGAGGAALVSGSGGTGGTGGDGGVGGDAAATALSVVVRAEDVGAIVSATPLLDSAVASASANPGVGGAAGPGGPGGFGPGASGIDGADGGEGSFGAVSGFADIQLLLDPTP